MKTETYYFQIPQENKRWDECTPITMEFSSRADAVNAAYLLSEALQSTIRFTDNPYYKGNSGTYILSKNISVLKA